MTFDEIKQHMNVLHQRRINSRIHAYIAQLHEDGKRSQFMTLILHDERDDKWFGLRMSSFRKVVKFVIAKKFMEARRLTGIEIAKMNAVNKLKSMARDLLK
jgi:hypothetical protein